MLAPSRPAQTQQPGSHLTRLGAWSTMDYEGNRAGCPRSPGTDTHPPVTAVQVVTEGGEQRAVGDIIPSVLPTAMRQELWSWDDPAEMSLIEAGRWPLSLCMDQTLDVVAPGGGSHVLGQRWLPERDSAESHWQPAALAGVARGPRPKGGPWQPPQCPLYLVGLIFPYANQTASLLL